MLGIARHVAFEFPISARLSRRGITAIAFHVPASTATSFPSSSSSRSYQFQQRRWIGDQSWGAKELEAQGEKIEKGRAPKEIHMSYEAIQDVPENIKALCDEILLLNVIEIRDLLARLQTRLGITDAQLNRGGGGVGGGGGGAAAAAIPAAQAAAPAVKDTFDIKLTVVDAKAKIKIIKEIRVITGLGLAESKALVEKAPVVIKEGVKKEEAEKIKKLLVDAGAGVEMA